MNKLRAIIETNQMSIHLPIINEIFSICFGFSNTLSQEIDSTDAVNLPSISLSDTLFIFSTIHSFSVFIHTFKLSFTAITLLLK
jgi:hypothetical protein